MPAAFNPFSYRVDLAFRIPYTRFQSVSPVGLILSMERGLFMDTPEDRTVHMRLAALKKILA
jgi:hypothetical protein